MWMVLLVLLFLLFAFVPRKRRFGPYGPDDPADAEPRDAVQVLIENLGGFLLFLTLLASDYSSLTLKQALDDVWEYVKWDFRERRAFFTEKDPPMLCRCAWKYDKIE